MSNGQDLSQGRKKIGRHLNDASLSAGGFLRKQGEMLLNQISSCRRGFASGKEAIVLMEDRQWIAPLEAIEETEAVEFCRQLLQIPSYSGQEQEAAEKMLETMQKLGYDRAWIDGVGNVVGEIKGKHAGGKVLFDGHLDTVPVSGSEKWTMDPFEGALQDGKIFGKGAAGGKGALAAMVYGLAPLLRHKDKLAGSIYISATVGVEQFQGLAFLQALQAVKPNYVVIGEATGLNVKRAQRGRAQISVTTWGLAAHSAYAERGENAVRRMLWLTEKLAGQPVCKDAFMGDGSLELTNMISAPYPGNSTVPHKCWATFDRYLLPGETEENALSSIRTAITLLQKEDTNFDAEVEIVDDGLECYTGQYLFAKRFFPAWALPEEHPLVQASLAALKQSGFSPAVSAYRLCTNGSYSAGVAQIPTIGFGPGEEYGMHVTDEHLRVKQLLGAAVGYQAIACRLLGCSKP
jgi:putative selenium metabolism hydrolase